MSHGTKLIQQGLNSLGYLGKNGARLAEDGVYGANTEFAARAWLQAGGKPKVAAPALTGLSRIIMHWTGGAHVVSSVDRAHYHFIIGGDGSVHPGNHAPEANISVRDGAYAAHTADCNTGSIGVAVAGMHGALERPFSAGGFPIREVQVEALVRLVADLCRKYGIPVTPQTVLSHAEVEPTLGIAQAGKWDIAWLPGMNAPADPVAIGNTLRNRISALLKGA